MPDYKSYRDHTGIDNPTFIRIIAERFPKFGKPAATCVNNPEDYGLCLTKDAEQVLVDNCGPGPGLDHIPFRLRDRIAARRKSK